MHALAASLENELITDSRSGVAPARRSETKREERKEREGRGKKKDKDKGKRRRKERRGKKNAEREKKRTVCVSPFSEIDTA